MYCTSISKSNVVCIHCKNSNKNIVHLHLYCLLIEKKKVLKINYFNKRRTCSEIHIEGRLVWTRIDPGIAVNFLNLKYPS